MRKQKRKKFKDLESEIEDILSRPTADLRRTARVVFDLGADGAYKAAQNGDIPCVQVNGRWRVVTARLRKLLNLEQSRARREVA